MSGEERPTYGDISAKTSAWAVRSMLANAPKLPWRRSTWAGRLQRRFRWWLAARLEALADWIEP